MTAEGEKRSLPFDKDTGCPEVKQEGDDPIGGFEGSVEGQLSVGGMR